MSFKDMLKYLRTKKGLSQDKLAEETGLSKSTISMYENGNRQPNFETLELLADYFNVDMNTLLDHKKNFNKTPIPILDNPNLRAAARKNLENNPVNQDFLEKILRNAIDFMEQNTSGKKK